MTTALHFLKSLFPPPYHHRIVLVGGTVRDQLIGRQSRDIDLVTALSHDELLALGFHKVEAVSATTIYFKHHPQYGNIEATRIGSMADLESDLHRRDFTINAMALDLSGTLIDPLGGAEDLKTGILRACGSLAFTADPLRIFRAFRFETDGWAMSPETVALIVNEDWSAAFSTIPVERFSNEMLKALTGKIPERFFQRMIEFGIGEPFLPEIFRMPAIPAGPLQYHPEGDLFCHSIQVLQRVATTSDDRLARFCAFFHDLGKLATKPALYPRHHGHDETGCAMAPEFCRRLHLPTAYAKGLAGVCRLHGKGNKWHELRDTTRLRMAWQALKDGITDILPLVSAADKSGGPPMTGWDTAVKVAGMSAAELGINQERLEAMPTKNRGSFIEQQRVDTLRLLMSQ